MIYLEKKLTPETVVEMINHFPYTKRQNRLAKYHQFTEKIQNGYPRTIVETLNGYLLSCDKALFTSFEQSSPLRPFIAFLEDYSLSHELNHSLSEVLFDSGFYSESYLYFEIVPVAEKPPAELTPRVSEDENAHFRSFAIDKSSLHEFKASQSEEGEALSPLFRGQQILDLAHFQEQKPTSSYLFDYRLHKIDARDVVEVQNYVSGEKFLFVRLAFHSLDNPQGKTLYKLYGDKEILTFDVNGILVKNQKNYLGIIPFVHFDNPKGEPDYWVCHKAIERVDEIRDANMKMLQKLFDSVIVTSIKLTEEQISNLKTWNVVDNLGAGGVFDIKTYDPEHEFRKNEEEKYIKEIFLHSGIFNFNEINLGNDPSGTALEYRLYPMKLKADSKENYFVERLYRLLFLFSRAAYLFPYYALGESLATFGQAYDYTKVKIELKRNLPEQDKFQKYLSLYKLGLLSGESFLSKIGLDYDKENKKIKEEKMGL